MYGPSNNRGSTLFWEPLWTRTWTRTRDGNAPSPRRNSENRSLARLAEMIEKFGQKLAMARHESILHARKATLEKLQALRRFGAPLLAGVVLPRRNGRVCGESNYCRVMLC